MKKNKPYARYGITPLTIPHSRRSPFCHQLSPAPSLNHPLISASHPIYSYLKRHQNTLPSPRKPSWLYRYRVIHPYHIWKHLIPYTTSYMIISLNEKRWKVNQINTSLIAIFLNENVWSYIHIGFKGIRYFHIATCYLVVEFIINFWIYDLINPINCNNLIRMGFFSSMTIFRIEDDIFVTRMPLITQAPFCTYRIYS